MNRLFVLLLISSVLFSGVAMGRDKSDVIRLENGDRITGEIKQLEQGKLRVSTDTMGTVQVDWDDIASLTSDYRFEFEISDGTRFYGALEVGADPALLIVSTHDEPLLLAITQVVRITQIEDSFWDRLTGTLSVGYNFTKASGVSQFSLSTSATYRTQHRSVVVNASSTVTSDQADETTQREDLNTRVTHFWRNRWFNTWLAGAERNDELGLDLRLSVGGGVGRHINQTSISDLSLLGGLILTRESLSGDQASQESVEGLLGLGYNRYIFSDPNVNISTQLQVYPSFTDWGRVRAQLDARVRYELINNLFLDLTLYDSYDSTPSLGAESTNDYGIVTSLGWSY